MLAERLGKDMGAVVTSYEVQIGDVGWLSRGLETGQTWRGDGARSQPGMDVSVVRGVQLEIVSSQVPVPAIEELEAVDDSRVGVESDSSPKPTHIPARWWRQS